MSETVEQLVYWIEERYKILLRKREGMKAPWSNDATFQSVYFCNVHRENDKVTKWIRTHFPEFHPFPEFNMMVARLVNKPASLARMNWPFGYWGAIEKADFLDTMSKKGAWGSAYIVSTNGRSMPKHEHIIEVLDGAYKPIEQVRQATTCLAAHERLQGIYGLASFMAAQIVADLKNTPFHPLQSAEDWWTFCAPGPGSLRGIAWTLDEVKCSPADFHHAMPWLREHIDENLADWVPKFCNQDLQNCLCEFDKYMRVTTGAGRSKRKYPGTGVNNRKIMRLNPDTAVPEDII